MRRKVLPSGSANNWWLRSPNVSNSNNFRYINSSGNVNNNNANNTYGVCFGFCNKVILDKVTSTVKSMYLQKGRMTFP